MRPWHPQIGYLPEDDDDPGEPIAIAAADPVEPDAGTYLGWLIDEDGILRPPGTPARAAPAPPGAPEEPPNAPQGAAGVRGALLGVVARALRRAARLIE